MFTEVQHRTIFSTELNKVKVHLEKYVNVGFHF